MPTPFGSYPFDAAGVDLFAHPLFINASRAPTTQDIYNPGTQWQNSSITLPIIYETTGAGVWYIAGGTIFKAAGTGTLVAGTVTIANTNIATTDFLVLNRIASNGSTALGDLTYTITAGTGFTVTSLTPGTPASTQTGDTSTFSYIIQRTV